MIQAKSCITCIHPYKTIGYIPCYATRTCQSTIANPFRAPADTLITILKATFASLENNSCMKIFSKKTSHFLSFYYNIKKQNELLRFIC